MPSFTGTAEKSHVPIKNHRYQIPDYPFDGPMPADAEPVRGTGMLKPWTRVSTLLDTHEDKEGLIHWNARLVAKGIGDREDLYALAASTRLEDKAALRNLCTQAFDHARGQASANLGTAIHNFLERVLDGEKDVRIPDPWRADIAAVLAKFQQHGIQVAGGHQELVIVRPDLKDGDSAGLAGRTDLFVQMPNEVSGEMELVPADYKTGSDPLAYGSWKIEQQIGIYGSAWATWDGTYWRPMPAGLRRDKVLMIHILPGTGQVEIYVNYLNTERLEADLRAAYRTRARRKQAKKAWTVLGSGAPTVAAEEKSADQQAYDYASSTISPEFAKVLAPGHELRAAQDSEVLGGTQQEAARDLAAEKAEDIIRTSAVLGMDTAKVREAMASQPARFNVLKAQETGNGWESKPLGGTGKPLAELAGEGERGCSVCRRKGHRKGSPVCLGTSDPAGFRPDALGQRTDIGPVVPPTTGPYAPDVPAAHCPDHGKGWTKDPETGKWVCPVCYLPSKAVATKVFPEPAWPDDRDCCGTLEGWPHHPECPQAEALAQKSLEVQEKNGVTLDEAARKLVEDAESAKRDGVETTGGAAVLSGDLDEVVKWWTPSIDNDTTDYDVSVALRAAQMVRDRALNAEDEDLFEDEEEEDVSGANTREKFLTRIAEAKDKATIRAIREEARTLGLWDEEMVAAGVARVKSL